MEWGMKYFPLDPKWNRRKVVMASQYLSRGNKEKVRKCHSLEQFPRDLQRDKTVNCKPNPKINSANKLLFVSQPLNEESHVRDSSSDLQAWPSGGYHLTMYLVKIKKRRVLLTVLSLWTLCHDQQHPNFDRPCKYEKNKHLAPFPLGCRSGQFNLFRVCLLSLTFLRSGHCGRCKGYNNDQDTCQALKFSDEV